MGTKQNPGAFDCHANAEDDEPLFTLLARDKHAPLLLRMWAELRAVDPGEDPAKVREARECADAMDEWRQKTRGLVPWRADFAFVRLALWQAVRRWVDATP